MENLSAFFLENTIQVENQKVVASKRFIDPKTKKPIEWEVKNITAERDEEIRKSATKRVQVQGKRDRYVPEIDSDKYVALLAAECTVYPNLNNADLQNSYGVMGAENLLRRMLTPGEYIEYTQQVQKINGFDIPFEEKVEEVKN